MRTCHDGHVLLVLTVLRAAHTLRPSNDEPELGINNREVSSGKLNHGQLPSPHNTFEVLKSGHLTHASHRERGTRHDGNSTEHNFGSSGQVIGLSLLQEVMENHGSTPEHADANDAKSESTASHESEDPSSTSSHGSPDHTDGSHDSGGETQQEHTDESEKKEKEHTDGEQAGGSKLKTNESQDNKGTQSSDQQHESPAPATAASETTEGDQQNEKHEDTIESLKNDLQKKKGLTPEQKAHAKRVAKMHVVRRDLVRHLEAEDADKWSDDLKELESLLRVEPTLFDINGAAGIVSTLAGERMGRGAGGVDHLTFLGRAAGIGWLPGVEALVEWDRGRNDSAPRLRINYAGYSQQSTRFSESPLTVAAERSHAGVVRYLLQQGADVMLPDEDGQTPLELAAAAGDADVVEALLVKESPLAHGLLKLHMDVNKEALSLPHWDRRWPFGSSSTKDEITKRLQDKVTKFGISVSAAEREVVGDRPQNWMMVYKNRIMHALATSSNLGSDNALQAEILLAAHNYDIFARTFTDSIILLFLILGFFMVFIYVIFRLRIFGGLEAPISLAHMVPGSFDPIRLADADFDPSRQNQNFQYRTVKDVVEQTTPSLNAAACAFTKAAFGIFSSWFFLAVRIPPVKDQFDEDFLSDDDDNSRARVCEQCAERARNVRNSEVFLRTLTLCIMIWWLCWKSERWAEASIIFFVYLQFSLIAACTASASTPVFSEKGYSEERPDSARLTYAIFGVQLGPRWARTVSTTRSTAAPNKSRIARRARSKRSARKGDVSDGAEASEDTAGANDAVEALSKVDMSGEACDTGGERREFFECWKRTFLQSGLIHIEHRGFLEMSTTSMLLIAATLLWLSHIRVLASGCFHGFYAKATPTELFEIYGATGSFQRGAALFIEVSFLFLVGERLHSITTLVQAAALTLQQRHRALIFASDHPPSRAGLLKKNALDQATIVREATRHIEEFVQCGEFATDLSTLRWAVLRTPVLLVFTVDLMLMALAISSMLLTCLELYSDIVFPRFHDFVTQLFTNLCIDPMVPLGITICLTWPLMLVLVAGALSNGEVFELRARLRSDVAAVISETPAGEQVDDVQYVTLRLKAEEAMHSNLICWPGGQALSLCEPSILIVTAAFACGLAVATGSALPGVVGGLQQTLL
jgi:ankyrin repeat protein